MKCRLQTVLAYDLLRLRMELQFIVIGGRNKTKSRQLVACPYEQKCFQFCYESLLMSAWEAGSSKHKCCLAKLTMDSWSCAVPGIRKPVIF